MATMTVTIEGVDRSANVIMSSVQIELNADRVGSSASFSITDPSPRTGSSPIRPRERDAVTIVYDSVTLFAGEISAIDTQYAPRELTYEITLQSYEAVLAATEIYASVSYVGTLGQQNTAKALRFTFDGDEAARIVTSYVSAGIGVTAAVGGTGKVKNLLTRGYRMARGTGASQRRVLDYKNGTVSDALDKIARVSGARWWIDGDKKLNWVKTRENLVGSYYDIESGSPLTTAGSWVRTNSTGPVGTDDYALVTSTASTVGYFDVAATAGLRYYFGAHGRPTTASNLFVDILFLDATKTTTLGSETITYATAATYEFKNAIATAPVSTAFIRMRVRNGATATQSRVDNLLLLEESAGFGISDTPATLEIAPEIYSSPSDFQSPCNQVRIKGKTTAGTGLRYEKFSQALYGTYAMTHEDAQSDSVEDVDAAAKAIFDSRAFPQKRHAYRTRWNATTKGLKVGSYQILRLASINDLDIQRVQAIRYEWNSPDDCVMYVALGAPPGALGQGLARVGSGVYGPAGPQTGTSVSEVTSPKATVSATVDTTATKPVVTDVGSFGYSGGGLRPATTSQRASTTAPVDDTLPDLPAPELPPGSLYALFPAVGDTVITRATLYRVSNDGVTWEAATSATLTADAVAAGTTGAVLIGDQIVAGTIDANSVNVTNINATNITTGTISAVDVLASRIINDPAGVGLLIQGDGVGVDAGFGGVNDAVIYSGYDASSVDNAIENAVNSIYLSPDSITLPDDTTGAGIVLHGEQGIISWSPENFIGTTPTIGAGGGDYLHVYGGGIDLASEGGTRIETWDDTNSQPTLFVSNNGIGTVDGIAISAPAGTSEFERLDVSEHVYALALFSQYHVSEGTTSSDLILRASSGAVRVQDSNVANGTNPRITFYNKNGTAFATVKSGAANVIQILNGASATDYGQLWAERIYPMNGTSASRYFFDDGTRLASSGGFDANGTIYASGAMVSDAISTTTQTSSAAIWVFSSGTTYSLRRNSSSLRYKENVVDADEAVLEAARKIKPRHYTSKIEDEQGAVRLGFIAEEVLEAGLTHAVGYDEEGRVETLDPTALIAALYTRVSDLERRLEALENPS